MKVLIIGGGISDEREVSLRSAQAVESAAKLSGEDVYFYDWDGSADWLLRYLGDFDVVLPMLHGKGGEDGEIQRLLEDQKVHFLGSSSDVTAKCFNKHITRNLVRELDYTVPKGAVLDLDHYKNSDFREHPHVIKPIQGGSSIHTHIIKHPVAEISVNIRRSFEIYGQLLIEECIEGDEITVGVLEGFELPVIEIIPPEGELFDYENKYNGKTRELCPPENVSKETQRKAKQMAQEIHKKLGCRHFSRSDYIVQGNEVVFLEINTIPGLTNQSLFPKAAEAIGLDFPQLVNCFIKLAAK